jgi:hypothetical protein
MCVVDEHVGCAGLDDRECVPAVALVHQMATGFVLAFMRARGELGALVDAERREEGE